jgi:hypothetical protein
MTAKLYKIEVPDYGDEEVNRMAVMYETMRSLPLDVQKRVIDWLTARLYDDRLKAQTAAEQVAADLQNAERA